MKLRKFITITLAAAMVFTCGVMNISAEEVAPLEVEVLTDAVEVSSDIIATGETYNYVPKTRGTTNVGDQFDRYDTLTANDAIDFFPFSLSSSRSVIFRFLSANANYAANLGLLANDGTVTLSNIWLDPGDVSWISSLGSGNYCWVVLSLNNTYTTGQYRLSMNARNSSSINGYSVSRHVATSTNFSSSSFLYTNGDILLNGENVRTQANDYVNNQMSGNVFKGEHTGAAPTNRKVTAAVISSPGWILGPLYYGGYTSTIPSTNPNTGVGYSSEHVILIPIDGNSYTCTYSTNLISTQIFTGQASGFLVYDLISGKVIDWMSSSNLLYVSAYGGFSNSYSVYMQL